MPDRPRVVIAGAGFGGLWAVRAFARAHVDISFVDCNNYHTFSPLLYQVAAAELEPEDIAYPVRSTTRRLSHVRFVMAPLEKIDFEARVVEGDGLVLPYEYLVLALGSRPHFFGVPGAEEFAFRLKTLEQAVALRNHLLRCFERSIRESDAARRQQMLTFAIVGGGPTGVEFAGALAELIYGVLAKDYPTLDLREVRVVLLEAMDGLLPGLPNGLRAYTLARMRGMGVDVRLQTAVSQITREAVQARDGTCLSTDTVVWTAGVRGVPTAQVWGLPVTRDGRVAVLPSLQVPGRPEVYVVGDLAYVEDRGRPLPMIAPVAIQEGVAAAQNILRQIGGQPPLPFRYRDRGTLVTIGRNAAVAHVWGRSFTGFPAWVLWLGVHLVNLIGFRNRLLVLVNWAWDYLFYERAIRLILPSE